MMAAYAALVSLVHTINQMEHHPEIQLESLSNNVTFLVEFLEGYDSPFGDNDALETRIADAAYAAEDVIEEMMAGEEISLQQVIEEMDSIKLQVMETAEEVPVRMKLDRRVAPVEIWNMPELRHVEFRSGGGSYLPQPPRSNDVVMEHLHTLTGVKNFKLSEEVVTRIPNVKILGMFYDERAKLWPSSYYCLNNVERLQKLKSLHCQIKSGGFLRRLKFPPSLEKLSLEAEEGMQWNNLLNEIASLPLLQKLQLYFGSLRGRRWTTQEGQFPSLKFLRIFGCPSFNHWTTRSSHFPRLEHLVLANLPELMEIPSAIGEIQTLKAIELGKCTGSMVRSAKRIAEASSSSGERSLQVEVTLWERNEELENLASANFHVQVI